MSLEFHSEPKPGYLLVTVSGEFDLFSAKDVSRRSLEACKAHALTKAVVDFRSVTGRVAMPERYDYGVFVAELHIRHAMENKERLQVAYVGPAAMIDPGKFGEIVATNRGANIKATTDMEEALAWLGVAPAGKPDKNDAA
jgi:hypothetical protein